MEYVNGLKTVRSRPDWAKGGDLLTNNIRSILLIQLGDVGDVVLTLPAIRALRECFPDANIVVAVRGKAWELIEDCVWASSVIAIKEEPRGFLKSISYQWVFFQHVRSHRFDMAIDFRAGTRGAILAYLSGARQRISFYTDDETFWRNWIFTDLILPPNRPLPHQLDHYQSLLDAYNIVPAHRLPEIHISDTVMKQTVSLLKNRGISSSEPFIALQPFSLWSYKEWKTANYVELVRQIQADYDVSIVVTGIPSERPRAQEIISQCKGRRVYNIAGETSLKHFSALLKCCKLFIGVDSAGGHIAAAVGTPCVVIFGPGLPSVWAPLGERSRIVHKDLPCVPCGLKGCQSSDVSLCLDTLTVEEVMPVVRSQLDDRKV